MAFDANGKYQPYDLNQPLSLPNRTGSFHQFRYDAPITELGSAFKNILEIEKKPGYMLFVADESDWSRSLYLRRQTARRILPSLSRGAVLGHPPSSYATWPVDCSQGFGFTME
ncbi:Ubiquitin-associated and SH3 domain-containing protein [Trichinella pseudospiralis]